MTIDAHQHFWEYHPKRHAWIDKTMEAIQRDFLPSDLTRVYKQLNIEGCVAVQVDQTKEETTFLLALAEQHDFIRGVVGWVDLGAPILERQLEYYKDYPKLCGFRHIVQSEADPLFLLRDKFLKGISKLAQYGYTYDILIFPHQLGTALELVKLFPNQKFIIDHIAKPYIKA